MLRELGPDRRRCELDHLDASHDAGIDDEHVRLGLLGEQPLLLPSAGVHPRTARLNCVARSLNIRHRSLAIVRRSNRILRIGTRTDIGMASTPSFCRLAPAGALA
jgi:hypothetical protein